MVHVTLLTGASKGFLGIGRSIAEIYLNKGKSNNLVAIARSEPELRSLVDKFGENRVVIVSGDVTDEIILKMAVDEAIKRFGQLNSIIANAGVLDPVDSISKADIFKWKKLFNVNFFSIVSLIQYALPELRKTKGNIIAVLSGASIKACYGWGAYGASKSALNHLILSVDSEEPDISAISIAPGVVNTTMQTDIRNKFGKNMTSKSLQKFIDLYKNNELLPPEVPAIIYVNLALKGWATELNGQYLRYNDDKLKEYWN